MSEQDGTQASTKRPRGHRTSRQNATQTPNLQYPANNDEEAWKAHWNKLGQPWRTEPEIDAERQKRSSDA